MIALAAKNVFRQRTRTLLTLAVINFGVAGLILIGGFIEDIFLQLQESTIHSQVGHIQVYGSGYTELGRREPFGYMIEEPEQVVSAAQNLPHVVDVMQRLNFSGLANNGRADLNVMVEGIEAEKEARLGTLIRIVHGRQLEATDDYGILLGKGVAQTLGLSPGDYLTLLVSTVDGALNSLEFEVTGIFQSFAQEYDNSAVRIPLAAAKDLVGTPGVHAVVFLLSETVHTNAVAMDLKDQLPAGEFEIKRWYEIADFYNKAVDLYRSQFEVLQFIILLMVLLSVANSVNMVVHERLGEFGTMRALGNRRRAVFSLILTENVLLGVIGAALGVALGAALALGISALQVEMPPLPNSDLGYIATIYIVPEVVGLAFTVGCTATVLAALLPAWRASRWPVADALSKNI